VTDQMLREGPIARAVGGDELGMVLRDQGGAIWGHAFASDITSGSAHFGIGIHQTLLGKGLGRELMVALLNTAERQADLGEIRLTCVQDNVAAIELYTSLGFEKTREFIEETDGLPYFAMRKVLRPESPAD
ncbi:MAG: GNAT family N-acetyltransferase, partial [Planctomycetota bacterium]